jgi:hypothetical protein
MVACLGVLPERAAPPDALAAVLAVLVAHAVGGQPPECRQMQELAAFHSKDSVSVHPALAKPAGLLGSQREARPGRLQKTLLKFLNRLNCPARKSRNAFWLVRSMLI